ncbi:hypothetical protein AAMO2058_000958600 [Amorphochlora amoebiformis]
MRRFAVSLMRCRRTCAAKEIAQWALSVGQPDPTRKRTVCSGRRLASDISQGSVQGAMMSSTSTAETPAAYPRVERQLQKLAMFRNAASNEQFDRANKLFYEIKTWPIFNVQMWNTMISMYGKRGKISHMQPMLREMLSRGVAPNEDTFQIMMENFHKRKETGAVLRVLDDMLVHNLKPRYPTCVFALKAHAKQKNVTGALRMFQAILDFRYKPGLEVFEIMLVNYAEASDFSNMKRMTELMSRFEVEAEKETYEKVFRALALGGNTQQAKEIADQMSKLGFEPTASMFARILPKMARNLENPAEAVDGFLAVADEYHHGLPLPDLESVIRELCKRDELEAANAVFKRSHALGIPSKNASALLSGLSRKGHAKEAYELLTTYSKSHWPLESGSISRTLECLVANLIVQDNNIKFVEFGDGKITEAMTLAYNIWKTIPGKQVNQVLYDYAQAITTVLQGSNTVRSEKEDWAIRACKELVDLLRDAMSHCNISRATCDRILISLNRAGCSDLIHHVAMYDDEKQHSAEGSRILGARTVVTYEELIRGIQTQSEHHGDQSIESMMKIIREMPTRMFSQLSEESAELFSMICCRAKEYNIMLKITSKLVLRGSANGSILALKLLKEGVEDHKVSGELIKAARKHKEVGSDLLTSISRDLASKDSAACIVALYKARKLKSVKSTGLGNDFESYKLALESVIRGGNFDLAELDILVDARKNLEEKESKELQEIFAIDV